MAIRSQQPAFNFAAMPLKPFEELHDYNAPKNDGQRVGCHGVMVFNKWDARVLLIRAADKGQFWGFPKGSYESKDGTPKENARRELKEETGLDTDSLLFLESEDTPGCFSWVSEMKCKNDKLRVSVGLLIAVYMGDDMPDITFDPSEIQTAGWFSPRTMLELLGDNIHERRIEAAIDGLSRLLNYVHVGIEEDISTTNEGDPAIENV